VLFVGNSLTAGHQWPLLVEALSAAGGRPLSRESVTYGGVSERRAAFPQVVHLRNGVTVVIDGEDMAILQAAAEEIIGKSRNGSSGGPDLTKASARVGYLMQARKSSRAPSISPMGRVMVMLEEIRAQNAATIDAVHASARELRADIFRLETRVSTLEAAFRYLSGEVTALKAEVGALKAEVGALKAEVAALKSEVFTLKGAMERFEGKLDSKADRAKLEALERRVEALENARA
jgi:polyhydroxyalkanoate synthesis regulator phasin